MRIRPSFLEIEALLSEVTGAPRVVVFDHGTEDP